MSKVKYHAPNEPGSRRAKWRDMLDIKYVRDHIDEVTKLLSGRQDGSHLQVREVKRLYEERNRILSQAEQLKSERNKATQSIEELKKGRKDIASAVASVSGIKKRIQEFDRQVDELDATIHSIIMNIPNMPLASVPVGDSCAENRVVRQQGAIPQDTATLLDHQDIGEMLDVIDFKRAAKMSGARFALLKGMGARLERALIQWMMDVHAQHGYCEIFPPFLVTGDAMTGTGQLPKFAEELYRTGDDLYLIPTAEVPVTNLHRSEILPESVLPLKYVAWTACFRREAGSYGKDTRGLIRNHQFNKVELVVFSAPAQSQKAHESLCADAARILDLLQLPYRVVELCTGDLGFAAAKTYDLEVWMRGEKQWREISSVSNFTDFQSRRMNIKMRTETNELVYAHTLNASGLAVGRTVAALLEHGQTQRGAVNVPEALRPYMGGVKEIVRQ